MLLLLDNHLSHLSLDAIDNCRANCVLLLSLPPHCSHPRQPLDYCVFRSLKSYINKAMDCWMMQNPGKTMSIYPSIVATALPSAVSQSNITAGFKCSVLFIASLLIIYCVPFVYLLSTFSVISTAVTPKFSLWGLIKSYLNFYLWYLNYLRYLSLQLQHFLPAYVTDRPVTAPPDTTASPAPPAATVSPIPPAGRVAMSAPVEHAAASPTPSTSTGEDADIEFSQDVLQAFPKAGPRKEQPSSLTPQ